MLRTNPKSVLPGLVLSLLCLIPLAAMAAPVIEFYNTNLDHYFITSDPFEAAAIDGGSAGPGWSRTGDTFNSGGSSPVCRFYGSMSPGPNSHFYTVLAGECDDLKRIQAITPSTQPRWNFESLDFISTAPAGGVCPAGTVPVYRAYNNGFPTKDSNHRITSKQASIQQVVARGWINEGVVMCAPPPPPAAANCPALPSGTYRILTPMANASVRTLTATLNATTMIFTFSDGRTVGGWSADGTCKFVQAGVNRFVVSPSGVAVWTSALFGTGMKTSLMFLEQTIPLADLAGTWNTLNFDRDNGTQPFDLVSLVPTFSATGQVTAVSGCALPGTCTANPGPFPTFVTNAAGGFNISGEPNSRLFAYRAASGDLMWALVDDSNSIVVATKTRTLAVPTIGAVTSGWSLTASTNGTSGNDFTAYGYTITAVDAVAKTYTRVSTIDGHAETLGFNTPRDGLSHRNAGTAATSSGGTVNVNEIYILGLPGAGL
ncbi:MAG: hypothetical protein ACMG6H_12590, partial [Acidobacteriota bacterium]